MHGHHVAVLEREAQKENEDQRFDKPAQVLHVDSLRAEALFYRLSANLPKKSSR